MTTLAQARAMQAAKKQAKGVASPLQALQQKALAAAAAQQADPRKIELGSAARSEGPPEEGGEAVPPQGHPWCGPRQPDRQAGAGPAPGARHGP